MKSPKKTLHSRPTSLVTNLAPSVPPTSIFKSFPEFLQKPEDEGTTTHPPGKASEAQPWVQKKEGKNKKPKKKSQKILKNSSLAKIFFFFKNIHNFIRANTNSKIQNTQKHKTHTQRDPQSGDALPQRGACRERVNVPEERERERERIFRALEFASK